MNFHASGIAAASLLIAGCSVILGDGSYAIDGALPSTEQTESSACSQTYQIQIQTPVGQSGVVAAWDAHLGLVNGGNPLEVFEGDYATCAPDDCAFTFVPLAGKPNTYSIQLTTPSGSSALVAAWGAHLGLTNGGNPLSLYLGDYSTCPPDDCDFTVVPIASKPGTYSLQVHTPDGQIGIVSAWDARLGLVNGGNALRLFVGTYDSCAPNDCDFVLSGLSAASDCPPLGESPSGSDSGSDAGADGGYSGTDSGADGAPFSMDGGDGGCVPPPDGIVSWWTGDGTASDLEGRNPGTMRGTAAFAAGVVGQAFKFDGLGNVMAGTVGIPTGSSDRTFEMWVNPLTLGTQTASSSEMFVSYGTWGTYGAFYGIYAGTGDSPGEFHWSQWGSGLTGGTVTTRVWTHVATTTSSGVTTLFVNGQQVANGTATPFNTAVGTSLYIGGQGVDPFGSAEELTGLVDELSVYNRALSAAEVLTIYQAGSAGKCKH
jgi:hypothetical protein